MSGAENRFFCKISDFRIKTCRKIGFFGIFLIFQQRWIFRPKLLIFSTVTNFSRVFAVFFGTAGEAWNVYMPKKYKNEIARSAKIFGFTYLKFVKISSELSEKCLKTHIFDPCSLIHVDLNSSRFSGFWGRAYLLFHPSCIRHVLDYTDASLDWTSYKLLRAGLACMKDELEYFILKHHSKSSTHRCKCNMEAEI